MALQGFSQRFTDLRDYILKITHEIWEDRAVDTIRDYYGETAPVYTPSSVTRDVEDVVKFTLQTLSVFPDRHLYGEDVIGSEDLPGQYYSSHRIVSTMTHQGDGFFGPPTGRPVKTRVIADCVCVADRIIEEWMVRDQAAILRDIGLPIVPFAQKIVAAERAAGRAMPTADELQKRWTGGPAGDDAGEAVESLLRGYAALWSNGALGHVRALYDRAAVVHGPEGRDAHGWRGIDGFFASYLASFPKGEFQLNHLIVRRDPDEPVRIAIRWSYRASHSGFGHFGAPTGADVVIMAISHFELRDGKILRDFMSIDELSIWTQILNQSEPH